MHPILADGGTFSDNVVLFFLAFFISYLVLSGLCGLFSWFDLQAAIIDGATAAVGVDARAVIASVGSVAPALPSTPLPNLPGSFSPPASTNLTRQPKLKSLRPASYTKNPVHTSGRILAGPPSASCPSFATSPRHRSRVYTNTSTPASRRELSATKSEKPPPSSDSLFGDLAVPSAPPKSKTNPLLAMSPVDAQIKVDQIMEKLHNHMEIIRRRTNESGARSAWQSATSTASQKQPFFTYKSQLNFI